MRIFIILFLLLSGCVTTQTSLSSDWRGKPADLLLKSLGAPAAINLAPNGNTLLGYTTESHKPSTSKEANVKCTTTYEVDKQHMIVGVGFEGQC